MERVVSAQIAAARKHDALAAFRCASREPGSPFASDPATSLQKLTLLAATDRLTFDNVRVHPLPSKHRLVTAYIQGQAAYKADFAVIPGMTPRDEMASRKA